MSLATAYASVIKDAEMKHEGAHFVQKLLSFMRHRGHLSLLPEVVRILEKEPVLASAVVTVASDAALKEFKAEIHAALLELGVGKEPHETVIDPRAVGGYAVRAGSKTIDNTFRSALVNIYQNTTRA